MGLGKKLKDARKKIGLTQAEAADKLGIDDTTISKYENDRSEPDLATLRKLAELYRAKTEDFVSLKKELSITLLDLSDDEVLKLPMYYEGMELTTEEKREFIAIVRGIFSARRALK